ncbi:MAG: hypothetical protein AAGD11_03135 [Planctomycetota bacterium]
MRYTSAALRTLLVCQWGWCLTAHAQSVASFDDIDFWVGGGENQAALIIDWDGESPLDDALVWGYRWDGSATAADVGAAMFASDQRLFAKLSQVAGLGTAIIGLGYDENNDSQFALTDNTAFDADGISTGPLSDGESSVDLADRYVEGWFLGFWHLGFADVSPSDWTSASTGVDELALVDQRWISLAFTTDTSSTNEFAENLVAALPTVPSADLDLDDDVDGTDFLLLQRDVESVLTFETWQQLYGQSNQLLATRSIPEPTCLCLLTFAVFTFANVTRRSF